MSPMINRQYLNILTTAILILFNSLSLKGQFTFNPAQQFRESITDIFEYRHNILALEVFYLSSLNVSGLDLTTLDESGNLLMRSKIELEVNKVLFARFLTIENDTAFILVVSENDSCKSSINFIYINLQNYSVHTISSFFFCDRKFYSINFIKGLAGDQFLTGAWLGVENPDIRDFVYKFNSNYELITIKDSLVSANLSIDFSRKGYVLKNASLTDFYDQNFIFRKQRSRFISGTIPLRQTHRPIGNNYLLELYEQKHNHDFPGFHTRIVDSNLYVVHENFIYPINKDLGSFYLPTFGGLDFIEENHVWIAGAFQVTGTESLDDNFYTITRVDSNLEICCQQFLGYDAQYNFNGIKASADLGVFVYGHRFDEKTSDYIDSYLIKLGPNCELPTTSTGELNAPLISISAHPNPGINELTFSVQGFDPTTLRVEMIDGMGRLLFITKDLSKSIQVPDLPAGQYFYRILQEDRLLGVGGWVKE